MALARKYHILVDLLKNNYNAKIIEVKLLKTNGLATTAALNTVENKIPDVNNIVKKKQTNKQILM